MVHENVLMTVFVLDRNFLQQFLITLQKVSVFMEAPRSTSIVSDLISPLAVQKYSYVTLNLALCSKSLLFCILEFDSFSL